MVRIKSDFQSASGISYISDLVDVLKSIIREQRKKLSYMMDTFKEYSPGLFEDRKTATINEFLEGIENSMIAVINARESQEIIAEIKKYQSTESCPDSDLNNFRDINGILEFAHVLSSAGDYLEKKYEKEKIFQRDKLKKIITIARLTYALLVLGRLYKLHEKFDHNLSDSYSWRDIYEIGLLQGELNLISSHLDPEVREIHFRRKSHESISRRWEPRKELIEEALKIAEEKWEKGDTFLHDEMANFLHSRFSKLSYKTLLRELRPLAKKYNRLRGLPGVKKEK